jgi:hypothetical protein
MLAFYMDHHVRAEITSGLRRRGIDVLTAFEDGASELPDDELLSRAQQLNRVVVTQDEDFLSLANKWQTTSREFAGVVFALRQDRMIGKTIEHIELIAHLLSDDEIRGRVEYVCG